MISKSAQLISLCSTVNKELHGTIYILGGSSSFRRWD